MSNVSGPISNLIGGVSQQPAPLRLATQCEYQHNFLPSVQDGLIRRPGTTHVAKLSSAAWDEASFIHPIIRGDAERYVTVVRSGDIYVYDLNTGEAKTVSKPNGTGYLSGTDFRAVTVADYTFIVNRATKAAMSASLSPMPAFFVVVTVKVNSPRSTYSITINGTERATNTTDGNGASSGTQGIAAVLRDALVASLGTGSWNFVLRGSSIKISRTDGAAFTCRCDDSNDGAYMSVIGPETQTFSRLPAWTFKDTFTRIIGDGTSAFDDYYVKYDADSLSDGSGTWKETIAQGIPYRIDAATMPHILVRESDGTFTFKRATWADRLVGDTDSAPEPSFIGRTINDIFLHSGRLGILAGGNVVLSRHGKVFDFWPQTVTQQLDTDRIDVAATTSKVTTLRNAIPFSKKSVLMFSDQTQFELTGGELLTPQTAAITQTTEYESLPKVKPVAAGRKVYFPIARGAYVGLREYSTDGSSEETERAPDVTSHVQKYIQGSALELQVAPNEDLLTVLAATDRTILYGYRYFFTESGEKVLSSWFTLQFGATILSHFYVGSILYLVINRYNETFLERLDLSAGTADTGSAFLYRMDRKIYETALTGATYAAGWTTFTLPFTVPTDALLTAIVRVGDPALAEGYKLTIDRPSTTTVRIQGNHTASKLCLGITFYSRYTFSPIYIRRQGSAQGSTISVTAGRLQIDRMKVQYARAGAFTIRVQLPGRDPFFYDMTAYDTGAYVVGGAALKDGEFSFPVRGRNTEAVIDLISDNPLPCHFTSAGWEGRYTTRSRGV